MCVGGCGCVWGGCRCVWVWEGAGLCKVKCRDSGKRQFEREEEKGLWVRVGREIKRVREGRKK